MLFGTQASERLILTWEKEANSYDNFSLSYNSENCFY